MDHRINIILVDYQNPTHRQDLVNQLIEYSADEMGGGNALKQETAEKSIHLLNQKSYAFSFLAYDHDHAVGFANCFESVATFAGACSANIHDIAVSKSHRGLGIGKSLLAAIEAFASKQGYYKLTLEVLEGNTPARSLYQSFGFGAYELDPEVGTAVFWQKILGENARD